MRFLSLFSGIESASVAWEPLGWTPVAFAEIEPFPCAVLAHHYPAVPNLGDVTTITRERIESLGHIDVVVGGFPCQDVSIAGKRKGFERDDGSTTRSGLFFDAMRIADWTGSKWLVIENVPGLFSNKDGRDFAAVVGTMAGCEFDVPRDGWPNAGIAVGPKGLVEWCVLDAQYHGLAQRRRRVFLVRDSGDWTNRPPLFLESSRLRGNPAPSREAREDLARTVAGGSRKRGGFSYDDVEQIGRPLRAQSNSSHDDSKDTYIAHSLRADGFDASEDGTGRGTPIIPLVCPTLRAGGNVTGCDRPPGTDVDTVESLIPVAYGGNDTRGPIPVATALTAHDSPRFDFASDTLLCFDETQITSAENRCNPQAGDPSHPLAAGARPPTIAFNARQDPDVLSDVVGPLDTDGSTQAIIAFDCKASGRNGFGIGEIAPTLRAMGHKDSHSNAGGQLAVAFQERGRPDGRALDVGGDIAYAITAPTGGGRTQELNVMTPSMAVRRLTPRECCRLQGFHDDYLDIIYRGKPAADGPKYKALGNSFAVPVVRWIGMRIDQVDQILRERAA